MACWGDRVRWNLQSADFKGILPSLAALPLPLGEAGACLRGLLAWAMDYEWRYLAQGQRSVRRRTHESMRIIAPEAPSWLLHLRTMRRFMNNSREEWQACLFRGRWMRRIAKQSRIDGLDGLLALQEQGRGVVLLSHHYDGFCMGMVLMGMAGLRVNVVNTVMIEHEMIHPAVRRFFQRKYRAMEALMHGRMPYHEREMPYFYDVLKKGQMVTLMGDIPGGKSNVIRNFLGRPFRLPLGAWHMARRTGALVGGYVCLRQGPGVFRVRLHPPAPVSDDPEQSLTGVYDFLDEWIRKHPERWNAADLLSGYTV
jgi:lauroyl/myristoyl acyltransferase